MNLKIHSNDVFFTISHILMSISQKYLDPSVSQNHSIEQNMKSSIPDIQNIIV